MCKELNMERPAIPQDDLFDVMEMTQKLESYMSEVLNDNNLTLAMSALISASINTMLAQCKNLEEVMFYRNIFMQIFDSSIKQIKLKDK